MGCNGICGTCVWHENFNGTKDWICSNEDSDSYEQSHPMTITALITNRNNKKRTQLHHKLLIISFDKG